jgi:protein gp37
MFDAITKTWNPVIGCLHNCTYCWARTLAETRLSHMEKYKDCFKPSIAEYELKKTFRKQYVFACDMGDLFGDWVPKEWILKVLEAIRNSPSSYFLFLTKNPKRYFEFLEEFPENLVLGATIETNREHKVSCAPSVAERHKCMTSLPYKRKMISIEPIMDFDPEIFLDWLKNVSPVLVHLGYANIMQNLPEPSLNKTLKLIARLGSFTKVKTIRLREKYTQQDIR